MPCDRVYDSTCRLACSRGYYGVGIGKAKCVLDKDRSDVVWKVEKFACKGNIINDCIISFTFEPNLYLYT